MKEQRSNSLMTSVIFHAYTMVHGSIWSLHVYLRDEQGTSSSRLLLHGHATRKDVLCCMPDVLLSTIQFLIECLLSRSSCISFLVMPFTVLQYMLICLIFFTTCTSSSQYHIQLVMHVFVQTAVYRSQSYHYYLL